jgi:hypothetical protein
MGFRKGLHMQTYLELHLARDYAKDVANLVDRGEEPTADRLLALVKQELTSLLPLGSILVADEYRKVLDPVYSVFAKLHLPYMKNHHYYNGLASKVKTLLQEANASAGFTTASVMSLMVLGEAISWTFVERQTGNVLVDRSAQGILPLIRFQNGSRAVLAIPENVASRFSPEKGEELVLVVEIDSSGNCVEEIALVDEDETWKYMMPTFKEETPKNWKFW